MTADEFIVRTLGTTVAVRAVTHAEQLRELWSRCLSDVAEHTAEPVVLDPSTPFHEALAQASSLVTLHAIDEQAGTLWMLHAAGIADPINGNTVALVAPSGTGKTTAAHVLAQRWGYVTDETVGIVSNGTVLPHPKPLSLVDDGNPWKRQVSPDEAGLSPTPAKCTLKAVALLNRVSGSAPVVRPIRTAEALVRLAEHSSHLAKLDRPLATMADHLERTGGAVEITYSEAADLAEPVSELMARP